MNPVKHEALYKLAELQHPTHLQRANTSAMSTCQWAVVTSQKEHAVRQPQTISAGKISPGGPVLLAHSALISVDSFPVDVNIYIYIYIYKQR